MSFDDFSRRKRFGSVTNYRDGDGGTSRIGVAPAALCRHMERCKQLDNAPRNERVEYAQSVLCALIADTSLLWYAAHQLTAKGDKAPGPNRQRLASLIRRDPKRVRDELRKISQRLATGTYKPGRTRGKWIAKSSGTGKRTIEMMNWQDQAVQKAIAIVLTPLVDPQLDELSLGYRPGHDRCEAIARATVIMEETGKTTMIAADLKDAFTTVPHANLLDTLHHHFECPWLTQLVQAIIRIDGRKRGIVQGGALSPLLLNLFLDRPLDQKWRREHPEAELIRVADDILIICDSPEHAQDCYQTLSRLVQPIGMRLKGNATDDIKALANGETAEWLGIAMHVRNERVVSSIGRKFWIRLGQKLSEAMSDSDGPLKVRAALQGICDQLGAVWESENHLEVIRRMVDCARALGATELPPEGELIAIWRKAGARFSAQRRLWRAIHRDAQRCLRTTGQGSATGHATNGTSVHNRSWIAPASVSATTTANTVAVVVTVTTQSPSGIGSWASSTKMSGRRVRQTKCSQPVRATRTRLALLAAIHGVRSLPTGQPVRVVTDDEFLAHHYRQVLDEGFVRQGKRGDGRTIANWDLMRVLHRALAGRWRSIEFQA